MRQLSIDWARVMGEGEGFAVFLGLTVGLWWGHGWAVSELPAGWAVLFSPPLVLDPTGSGVANRDT